MMQKKFALATVSILLFFAASAKSQTTIRVNAGGPAYTDSQGQLWSADYGFNAGTPSSCAPAATVTGTTDPQLYKPRALTLPHLLKCNTHFLFPTAFTA